MSEQVHVLRLGPARLRGSLVDPKSGLFLTYPEKVVGKVPFGADISNLVAAMATKALIDVNGTVQAEWEAMKAAKTAAALAAEAVEALPAEVPAPAASETVAEAPQVEEEPKFEKKSRNKK